MIIKDWLRGLFWCVGRGLQYVNEIVKRRAEFNSVWERKNEIQNMSREISQQV
jgi:hypothetical protein